MSRKFLTPIDLSGLELQNAVIQNLTSTPTAIKGRIYFDSNSGINVLKVSLDGSTFVPIATTGSGGSTITLGSTSIALGSTSGISGTPITNAWLTTPVVTGTANAILYGPTSGSGNLSFYFPQNAGTLVGTGDSGSVTNGMLAGSIANGKLTNSTISGVALGSYLNTLTLGQGLGFSSGTSYDGSTARVLAALGATSSTVGVVMLNDTPTSGDTSKAATPNSVYVVQQTAAGALQRSGGTMSGPIAMGGYDISGGGTITAATFSGSLGATSTIANGVTAVTQPANDNTSKVATTYYVDRAVATTSAGFNVHNGVSAATTANLAWTYVAGGGIASTVTGSGTSLTVTTPGFNIAIGQVVSGAGISGTVYVTNVTGTGPFTVTLSATVGTITGSYTFVGADGGTGVGATLTNGSTGTTTIDSYTLAAGDRILVKNQTTQTQNGVYTVTTAGTTGVATVLTRASDYDNSVAGEVFQGDLIYIGASGSGQSGSSWVMNGLGSSSTPHDGIKIGTDKITFVQFDGPTTNGVTMPQYGGTGINNASSSTITLGGSLTLSGAFTTSITVGANTSVTLPSSGTLVSHSSGTVTSITTLQPTNALTIAPASNSSTGYALAVTGGASSSASTGGAVNITGGASPAGTGGSVVINAGLGSTSGTISVGLTNTASVQVGASGVLTSLPSTSITLAGISTGTAGIVAIGTGGLLSRAVAGTDYVAPSAITGMAKKVTQVGTGTGQTISVTHGLGTNLVHAQVYDTSTATASLVEVDIAVTSTTATATFASNTTTLSNYTLVVVG